LALSAENRGIYPPVVLFDLAVLLGLAPSARNNRAAFSELHVGFKGTMNALYLKDLAQKTRRGLEGRVRQGKSSGYSATVLPAMALHIGRFHEAGSCPPWFQHVAARHMRPGAAVFAPDIVHGILPSGRAAPIFRSEIPLLLFAGIEKSGFF